MDVLYVDWLEWLDPHGVEDNIQFSNIMAAFIQVGEGGVVFSTTNTPQGAVSTVVSNLNEPIVI